MRAPAVASPVSAPEPQATPMLDSLRFKLGSRPTVRRMISGGGWLGLEQALRMGFGLVGGVWVARHLGPEDFGLLSATLAVVAVLGGLASLGFNTILVREIAQSPERAGEIQATGFFLKLALSTLLWLGCVAVTWSEAGDGAPGALLPLAALVLVFQSMDVAERRLQAQAEWRRLVLIRCAGVIASFALRATLILVNAPLEYFALAGVCEVMIAAAGLAAVTRRGLGGFAAWCFCAGRAKALLKEGLPLMGAGLAIQVQAQSDQIMLVALQGGEEVGQYSAALRIVTVFAFFPMVLQTLSVPELARAKADDVNLYRRRLHRLYRLAVVAGVATAAPLFWGGPTLVVWLFGDAYAQAGVLLPLFSLRLLLASLGVARGAFLNTEGMARFVLITAVAGAVVNVGLNLVFIPRWGATGAIVASLLSFTVTTFGFEWTDPRARRNLRLMVAAMLRPWRSLD